MYLLKRSLKKQALPDAKMSCIQVLKERRLR